jgi:hypothetical protein
MMHQSGTGDYWEYVASKSDVTGNLNLTNMNVNLVTEEQYKDKGKLLLEHFQQAALSEEPRNCNLSVRNGNFFAKVFSISSKSAEYSTTPNLKGSNQMKYITRFVNMCL